MSENGFSRRYFFYGALLAGAVPARGFGSTPSLKRLGYKSPNEKLNLAAIGAGGQPAADLKLAQAGVENVVALADVDWVRGKESFERFPNAKRYKDFRQMLDQQGKEIDAVVSRSRRITCTPPARWRACNWASTSTWRSP